MGGIPPYMDTHDSPVPTPLTKTYFIDRRIRDYIQSFQARSNTFKVNINMDRRTYGLVSPHNSLIGSFDISPLTLRG